MSGAKNLTSDVDLDLKGLVSAIWRKKILIVLLSLISGALIFAATSAISPRYKSDAQILIKKRESLFTRIPNADAQQSGGEFDEQAIGSQVLILNSDDLASRVIKKLNLESHREFQEHSSGSGLLEIAKSVFQSNEEQSGEVAGVDVARTSIVVDPGVLKQFKEQLTVYAAEKSRVVIIEFWSKDRQLAQLVPNMLAEIYLDFTRDTTLESEKSATGYLEPEIEELRKQVKDSEMKVAEFRSNSDILLGNNNALLATQQLSEVSSELSRVKAETSAAEAKIASIRTALNNGGSVDVIPEVIASPLVQRLRERQVSTLSELSQLSSTLLPSHPRVKALTAQLPEIEKQLRSAANNILRSLENNVDLAKKKETALLQDVNRLKAESSRVGDAEVQLRALEREANAQRERLESYLGRFNEAQSRQNSGYIPSEARIIEHAVLPSESYFPKVIPFTIAGTLAAAILSMVGVLAAELLSGRAFRPIMPVGRDQIPERVEIVGAPSVAPSMDDLLKDEAPVFAPTPAIANDRDVFASSFAMQAIDAMQQCNVAVVTADEFAGSSTAIEIMRYLANQGRSVVLTDLTVDSSSIRSVLGNVETSGLFDVLSGTATLRQVIYEDTGSSAHVLAPGNTENPSADLSRLSMVVDALASTYDFTIFDCGNANVNSISKIANAETVIVIPVNQHNFAESKALERQLKASGYSETLLVRSANLGRNSLNNAA